MLVHGQYKQYNISFFLSDDGISVWYDLSQC